LKIPLGTGLNALKGTTKYEQIEKIQTMKESRRKKKGSQVNYEKCSSVVIMTGYGMDGRVSISDRDKRIFSSPQGPDLLWDPPTMRTGGSFPGD
jgi:hypothetical protein